nr:Chain Q, peptide from Dermokine [Homo sapiens]
GQSGSSGSGSNGD